MSANYCISQSGRIASIYSDEENEAIIGITNRTGAYIGAELDGDVWKWNDGTPWWQPSSDKIDNVAGIRGLGKTRIVMNLDKWHDIVNGDRLYSVICAKDLSPGKRYPFSNDPSYLLAYTHKIFARDSVYLR